MTAGTADVSPLAHRPPGCSTASSAGRLLRIVGAMLAAMIVAGVPAPAQAQTGQSASLRGVGHFGFTTFAAADTFKAVVGSSNGVVFGGGVEVVLRRRIFFAVNASRFSKTGQRVFVFEGETFPLGIDDTVTVIPVEFSAGYRFERPRTSLTPYAGAGLSLLRLRETSEFAGDDDDVSEQHAGVHVLGGIEWRASGWIGVAGEAQWSRVRGALGDHPSSAAREFDENDLGGTTVRVKVIIGR